MSFIDVIIWVYTPDKFSYGLCSMGIMTHMETLDFPSGI